MPRVAKAMTAMEVKRLAVPGMHAVGTVPGLHLQVLPSGGRTWVLRVTVGAQATGAQRRREVGLGGYPEVPLADAWQKARELRGKLKDGRDPVEERRAAKSALSAAAASTITFEDAALKYIAAHEKSWSNAKHAEQWRNTLKTYAYPHIGKLHVSDIGVPHVLRVLEPIWHEKTETATRVRSRMEHVLTWAKGRGYRTGDNPARKEALVAQLPEARSVAKVKHHTALPVADVPAFMVRLRGQEGAGARALEFAILTAARSGEVRGATWGEIDRENKVWAVPADRMKAKKEHRVPLTAAALKLIPRPEGAKDDELIFPAQRGGTLSDMTLSAVLKRMEVDAVPHGFRSSFRDWAAERTNHPHEVAEMALAHVVGNKVEAAYRRGDLFEKRRAIMKDWEKFCGKA